MTTLTSGYVEEVNISVPGTIIYSNSSPDVISSSSTVADGTVVDGGMLIIGPEGTSNQAIIESGWENVTEGGTANGVVVNGGSFSVGGVANDTTVNAGGYFDLGSELGNLTEANRTTVNSGGVFEIYGAGSILGATASLPSINDTTISSGGVVIVDDDYPILITSDPDGTTFVGDEEDLPTGFGGSILDNGQLIFSPVSSSTIAHLDAVLTGSGSVVISGGTLALSGGDEFTGSIVISGGTLELVNATTAGASTISFAAGTSGTLQIDSETMPIGTIEGLGTGDIIDLKGVAFDPNSAAVLQTSNNSVSLNNVLHVFAHNSEGELQDYRLQLDPTTSYTGGFSLSPDGAGGTAITFKAGTAVVGTSSIASSNYSTSIYPYDAVVYIGDADGAGGTGFIIGPHSILTAAHVVELPSGEVIPGLTVYPGSGGTAGPTGTPLAVDPSNVHASPLWSAAILTYGPTVASQFDWAVINVSQNLTGFGEFDLLPDYGSGTVNLTGYPEYQQNEQIINVTETTAPGGSGVVLQESPRVNVPGESGSPLWIYDGADARAVGIVSGTSDVLITPSMMNDIESFEATPACYLGGSLITTDHGDIPIERLKIGNKVRSHGDVLRPIKWIGQRTYSGRFIAGRKDILPICIKAGALDVNAPSRDLWISPHHAMFIDGVLIEARDLVNGGSILQAEKVEQVDYFHIELETHDVIVAEGVWSETFVDDDSRGMFHNAPEFAALYPDEVPRPARYCAPRLDAGYELEVIRAKIAARAGFGAGSRAAGPLHGHVDSFGPCAIEGWAQSTDHPEVPVCLDIFADGRLIGQTLANRYREDLKVAGLGSGRHAFVFAIENTAVRLATWEVKRSIDGAVLAKLKMPIAS